MHRGPQPFPLTRELGQDPVDNETGQADELDGLDTQTLQVVHTVLHFHVSICLSAYRKVATAQKVRRAKAKALQGCGGEVGCLRVSRRTGGDIVPTPIRHLL